VDVESAEDMLTAVLREVEGTDIFISTAAVADYRPASAAAQKIKKTTDTLDLCMERTTDVLATVAARPDRPFVVGFAAETENVIANAKAKLNRKGCDWIVANDVSPETGIMGGETNSVHLVTADGVETWPSQSKDEVARALVARIADALTGDQA